VSDPATVAPPGSRLTPSEEAALRAMWERKEDHQAMQPMYHWRMKKDQKGEWDLLELVAEIPASKLPIPIRNK
jgi:branched-chain amino acid transport system substrate-binding protein